MNIDDTKAFTDLIKRMLLNPLIQAIDASIDEKMKGVRAEIQRFALNKELYVISEACEKLSMKKSTLYKYIDEGKIKCVEVGGKKMITKTELMNFLRSINPEGQS